MLDRGASRVFPQAVGAARERRRPHPAGRRPCPAERQGPWFTHGVLRGRGLARDLKPPTRVEHTAFFKEERGGRHDEQKNDTLPGAGQLPLCGAIPHPSMPLDVTLAKPLRPEPAACPCKPGQGTGSMLHHACRMTPYLLHTARMLTAPLGAGFLVHRGNLPQDVNGCCTTHRPVVFDANPPPYGDPAVF